MRSHDTSKMPRPGKTYRGGFTASWTLFLRRGGRSRVRFSFICVDGVLLSFKPARAGDMGGRFEHVTHARCSPAAVAAVVSNLTTRVLTSLFSLLITHTHTHTHYYASIFPDLRHPDKGSLNEGGRERDTSSFDGFPSPRDNDGAEDGMVSRSAPNASALQRAYSLE